jgi:hypothetical protein
MSTTHQESTASDRRKKRSSDPLVALHYQLSLARAEGELETIVLADPSGVVVAGAGSWAACEELAAYAPLLLLDEVRPAADPASARSRVDEMRSEVTVRSVDRDRAGGFHRGEREADLVRGVKRATVSVVSSRCAR